MRLGSTDRRETAVGFRTPDIVVLLNTRARRPTCGLRLNEKDCSSSYSTVVSTGYASVVKAKKKGAVRCRGAVGTCLLFGGTTSP